MHVLLMINSELLFAVLTVFCTRLSLIFPPQEIVRMRLALATTSTIYIASYMCSKCLGITFIVGQLYYYVSDTALHGYGI